MNDAHDRHHRPVVRRTIGCIVALLAGTVVLGAVLHAQPANRRAATPNDAFYWLNEQNKASLIMLADEGIITKELGTRIARSLMQIIADGAKPGAARSIGRAHV